MEMLIAMLILSVLLTGVYSAFHAGVVANKKFLHKDNASENMLGRLNIMAMEIRNAVYWNNAVLVGARNDLYFYAPMTVKNDKDIFPLYRVHYRFQNEEGGTGTLVRAALPWMRLQKPGMNDEEIARLEKQEPWIGPVRGFRMEFAVRKKRALLPGVRVLATGEDSQGTPVEGNGNLVWRQSFDARREIPYGVRLRWDGATHIFWPAMGLYQPAPVEQTVLPQGVLNTSAR